MPHLDMPEILLLLAVALPILGPRKLPELVQRVRRMSWELRGGAGRLTDKPQVRAAPEDDARLRS